MSKTLQKAARITAFLGALLTLVVGIIHLCDKKARITYNNNLSFVDDNMNAGSWRMVLFSFAPDVFIDAWTPFAFGLWGMASHLKGGGKVLKLPTEDFANAAVFQVIMALFATIAYGGGIGMIFSVAPFVAAILSIVCIFKENGPASLELSYDFAMRSER